MDPDIRKLVEALHAGLYRYVLAVTGGGAGAAAWLLSVPGGSRTFLAAHVPYDQKALDEFLARPPASYCSPETAALMARRALEEARWLSPGVPVAGVGCTASLRSDRPKRGDHRFHAAVATGERTRTWSLTLTKDARTREAEEEAVDRVLLNAMAEAFGVGPRTAVPLLPGEEIQTGDAGPPSAWARFWSRGVTALCQFPDGRLREDAPPPTLVLPGSFNPLHEGHAQMARCAAEQTGRAAAFELTVANADKPPLEPEEVRRRLGQFHGRGPVWVTRAATFVEKARLFPGAAFVLGADTAARVVEPRFYGGEAAAMNAALDSFRRQGCRFLVAGRVDAQGRFVGLADLALPAEHRDLFEGIPEEAFRRDLSSTQLRAGATQ